MTKKPTLIVLTGPTASGKSALAVSLAKKFQTEIISADSRQIYKDIPIATAVPSIEEREGVVHHLLEALPLDAYYSAARFREDAMELLNLVFLNSNFAIVCGGSMLYIDALTKGIDNLPTVPLEIRDQLMEQWRKHGNAWLIEKLRLTDPGSYYRIDLCNLKRVFHAIEISLTAGKPYSTLLTEAPFNRGTNELLPFRIIKFCLSGERKFLFERINTRVLKMMDIGLEEEAQKVYPLKHLNSLNTVGLKEMFEMFEGRLNRTDAISRIQKNTRVYAKKQLTWHKRDNKLVYLDFTDSENRNLDKIENHILHH